MKDCIPEAVGCSVLLDLCGCKFASVILNCLLSSLGLMNQKTHCSFCAFIVNKTVLFSLI